MDAVAVDVGQGQSIVLKSGTHFAVVDCGSGNSWRDAGCDTADMLLSMGCRSVERVLLTHFDDDHINGFAHLLTRIGVETLTVPETPENRAAQTEILALAAQYGVAVEVAAEQTILPFGNVELTVFPPLGTSGSNELGLSVLASAGEGDFLITGDMDAKTETKLVETYDLPDIEVLLVGHHGSKYSTGTTLLESVTPEAGVISVGDNSYGHPTEEALLRLTDAGMTVYRTDMQGNILITVD